MAVRDHILITGGAGFLGANIASALAQRHEHVLVFDNLARAHVEDNIVWLKRNYPDLVSVQVGDVRDRDAVDAAAAGARAIIHLAGQVAVTTSVTDPVSDFEVNARGTLNVLEAARLKAPQAPVLFASTNKVYGKLLDFTDLAINGERYEPRDEERRKGFAEETPLSFHSPYGCSKGAADQYVLDYARIYGLKTTVFRMSCLYGPHQFGHEDQGWVAHFLISALSRQRITIFGDGRQVRDVLYVTDAVRAYLLALDDPPKFAGRVFNLGGGPANTLSLLELMALIQELTGEPAEYSFDAWRPGDQAWYVSDTRALETTGWRAEIPVEPGLKSLAHWLRKAVVPAPQPARLTA